MVYAVLGYISYLMLVLEVGTSSIGWAQLSRFHLKMETESSLKNIACFQIKHGDG
jgi:hypothetical protein